MMWELKGYTDQRTRFKWAEMAELYPWVKDMIGVQQDPVHHAEGDVFVHTGMVVESLLMLEEFRALNEQDKRILFASAMLHDVEKRSTTEVDAAGNITAPRHARRGEYTARSIIYREHPAPFHVREAVCKLVRYHGFPIWFLEKPDYLRKLIECSLHVNTEHLYMLAKADMLGRNCGDLGEMMYRLEMFKEICIENNCYGEARRFDSDMARYKYLSSDGYIDYVPFDDTKFEVVMMAGIPGAGKDTAIASEYSDLPIVSIDDIRRRLKIKPDDKEGNGRCIQEAKEMAKEHMRKKQSFVWNATNVTRDMRSKQVRLFTEYGGKVTIAYVETPYHKLLQQNSDREHAVPAKVVEKLIDKLEMPGYDEAHSIKYFLQ